MELILTLIFLLSVIVKLRISFRSKKYSGDKASHWYFITDFPEFINITTKAIRKVGERIIWKYDAENAQHWIRNLKVFDVTYKINYTDESKARIVTEKNVDSFITKQFYPQDFHQKGTSFKFEKEVRTVWIFMSIDKVGRVQPLQIPPPDTEWEDLTLGKLPISKWCKRNNFPLKTTKSKLPDL